MITEVATSNKSRSSRTAKIDKTVMLQKYSDKLLTCLNMLRSILFHMPSMQHYGTFLQKGPFSPPRIMTQAHLKKNAGGCTKKTSQNVSAFMALPVELLGMIVEQLILDAIQPWKNPSRSVAIEYNTSALAQTNRFLRAEAHARFWKLTMDAVVPCRKALALKFCLRDSRTERAIIEGSGYTTKALLGHDGWDTFSEKGTVRCLCKSGSMQVEGFPLKLS